MRLSLITKFTKLADFRGGYWVARLFLFVWYKISF